MTQSYRGLTKRKVSQLHKIM